VGIEIALPTAENLRMTIGKLWRGLLLAGILVGFAWSLWSGFTDYPAYRICDGQLDWPQQFPSACD
jgi:hypothetical protein